MRHRQGCLRLWGYPLTDPIEQLKLTVQVVKGLREGDVLWIQLDPGAEPEEIDAVQVAVSAHLGSNATVFVSPRGFPERINRLPLSELLRMRDALDGAITAYTAANLADVEV